MADNEKGTEKVQAGAEAVNNAPKKKLGITKETTSGSGIPIGAPVALKDRTPMYPNKYEFPIARLVNVVFDPAKEVKRNDEVTLTPVISFVLTTKEGKKFTHVEFPVDDDDAEFQKKNEQLNQRIKHIFVETVGENKFEEGDMVGDDYAEFFSNVAKAFNKHTVQTPSKDGEETKTVALYTRNQVYFKVTYYKDRLQLPLFPNFIQRAFAGTPSVQIPCDLLINPTYDKLEPQAKTTNSNPAANQYNATGRDSGYAGNVDDDYPDLP